MNTSFRMWETARFWCRDHPGKAAKVVSSDGEFTIVFTLWPDELKGVDHTLDTAIVPPEPDAP